MTEVGLIPTDWEVVAIDDILNFEGGAQPPRDIFVFEEKTGYIRLLQIRDYKTDKYASYIPSHLVRKKCDKDDIMIGRYGPPIFQILCGLEGAYNVALIKAIPKQKVIKKFAWFVLTQEPLFDFVEKLSQRSSGQTGVDLNELRKYQIPLPTLAEQTAIATALSDADAYINSLESLIAKKQAIKQGAMQSLLSPKAEWEVRKLGEVAEIRKGQLITESQTSSGDIPVIAGGMKPSYFHNKANRRANTITVSASGANAGFVAFHTYEIFASDCSTIEDSPNYSVRFLFYFLQSKQNLIYKQQTGGAQPHIYPEQLKQLDISLPPLAEQARIATILSDMDADLAATEAQLSKARSLKQGMMQQLLTGKIRLPHS